MKDIYRGVDRLSSERMVQRLGTSISESLYHTTYSKQKTDGMETSVMQSVGGQPPGHREGHGGANKEKFAREAL